jgi:hypothetical protein
METQAPPGATQNASANSSLSIPSLRVLRAIPETAFGVPKSQHA